LVYYALLISLPKFGQAGLFSVTVAIFLTESYKLLSPDLNNAITVSLTQIAQPLVGISNATGAPFQNIIAQSNAPFKHAASAIRINVMWLLSLVLSLTYALSAALAYWGFAQQHGARHKYAYRLRGIVSRSRVVDSTPTLLHLSIFLFIAGLINFLLLINKTAAFCVLGYVSVFTFACLVFTALPRLYLDDPPRTSLPGFAWRISLILVLAVLVIVVEVGGLIHGFLSSIWIRSPLCASEHPPALATWRNALEGQIRKQQRSPTDGLQRSINLSATAVQLEDANPLCQALSTLDQDQKIEDFVTRIPGVFDSGAAVPCSSSAILSSIIDVPSDRSTSDPILGSCFHDLLDTCIPDTSPLTEESRRNRLRRCLKSLWYCGKAYHRLGNSAPLPHHVRAAFASPETARRIRNEQDPTARVIGRCFTSLVAKKLSCDAKARTSTGLRFSDAELASLSAILGASSEMMDRFCQPGVIGLANIISLLSGETDTLLDGKVPLDVEQIIQETVVILGTEALRADKNASADLPLDLVAQFQGVCSKATNAPAPEWLKVQLEQISERLPSEQGLDDDERA
jgi:hypothetical protein